MGAKPELVYRTTIQPDAPPPKIATPPDPDAPLHAAIAEFVCTREQNLKKQFQSEDGLIRDRLALLQRELAAQRDLAEQERTLNARAIAADQVEREGLHREIAVLRERELQHDDTLIRDSLDLLQREVATLRELAEQERTLSARATQADQVERELLRRELSALREQIALEHGLRDLRNDVTEAKKQIPKLPVIVSQLQAETTVARTDTDKKIAALERELSATNKRLNKSRVDQSIANHALAELRRAHAAAKTEIVEIETNTTRFTISGLNPQAASTLRTFAQSCLDSEEIWISPPAGTA
jgi:chromosome segregation ATPase